MTKERRSRWMLIGSMTIFGTIGLFVRNIPIPSAELALCRATMAALILGLHLLFTGQFFQFTQIRNRLPLLLLSGLALGVNWILLFEAYRYTTVSTATLSYYFAPVLVTALSPILFKEKLTGKQILCFLMSTLGLVLITGVEINYGGTSTKGICFGLGAAFFYATVILLNKCIHGIQAIHRTFFQFLAAVLTLIPYVLVNGGFHLNTLNFVGWVHLLIVGTIHTGLAYCLYFSSLVSLPGQKAAILSYIDPLVAVLVSVALLGEPLGIWQILGGSLILGFTLLNEISDKK